MTNPKMLSSENSCSVYQYLHQDQDSNHTFFIFSLASMDQHLLLNDKET